MSYVNYYAAWGERIQAAYKAAQDRSDFTREDRERFALMTAIPSFLLFCLNEEMRKNRATPWETLEDLRALRLYVIERHHWLPAEVFQMTEADLQFVLHQELIDLELPEAAYVAAQADIETVRLPGIRLNRKSAEKASGS